MSTTTIDAYNTLAKLGVPEKEARTFIDTFVTREEATQTLVTREYFDKRINTLYMWVAALFIGQLAAFATIVDLIVRGAIGE